MKRLKHIANCLADSASRHKDWEERLVSEYDRINEAYDLGLTRPNIVVKSGNSTWRGLWSPKDRSLSISMELIGLLPWPEVIKTLKHEIAHQVANETFKVFDGPEHLKCFQQTCELLGIPEEAHDHDNDIDMQQNSTQVMAAPQVYIVIDPKGKKMKMKYLGAIANEAVFSTLTYGKNKSVLITNHKRFELIRNALVAAGVAKFLGKVD